MSVVVEKNDVDISKIFIWGKEFAVLDKDDKVIQKLYIRLLGDADLNRARVYALRKSAELRKNLRTVDSDERIALIFDPESLEDERLVTLIVGLSIRELTQAAVRGLKLAFPKSPKSDAPLEDLETYQQEIDEYASKREAAIKKNLEKEVEKLTKILQKLSREELTKRYENTLINEACEQEVINRFREASAFYGTYRDKNFKKKYFRNIEDFQDLPTDIKNQFIAAQQSIELSGEDLKKLQRATP
jgi:hypothetical protein